MGHEMAGEGVKGRAARGTNSGYKRARRGVAAGRGRVGGPGRVGRAAEGRGWEGRDPLSLIKLYEYAILLSRFLPPSSLLLVMFLSCL